MAMRVAVWLLLASSSATAQGGLITRDEALAAVFPGAQVEAERVFLTADQTHRAAVLAGGAAPLRSWLGTWRVADERLSAGRMSILTSCAPSVRACSSP